MKPTLIVVRRIVATPKTAGAGVMFDASFPMFTRPIATSSERIAPSCVFDLSVMDERQGGRARWLCRTKVVWRIPNTDKDGRPSRRDTPGAARPTRW